MNTVAVTDAGYKVLLEKHNNPEKKEKFCVKSSTVQNFLENLNFI